ncbi:MAG: HD-like signal output (HDOD) protein [Motiliproteus sp.]
MSRLSKALVERLSRHLGAVAPFSLSVQTALTEMGKEQVDLPLVCSLLETDPVLIASILRLANSPFYGFAREIGTVSDATVLLGVHSLKQLVISYSLITTFSQAGKGCLDRQALWRNAIAVAVAAKVLARETGQDPDMAFVAGILSDIGLVVMEQCLGDDYRPVLAYRDQQRCALVVAEQAVLGVDHGKVGADAINTWGLPDVYAEIAMHCDQRLDAPPGSPLVDVVHLASLLVKGLWISTVVDTAMIDLTPQTLDRLGLDWARLETLLPEIEASSRDVIDRLLP